MSTSFDKAVKALLMIYQNTFLNKPEIFIHAPVPRQGSNLWSKNFVSGHQTQKAPFFNAHNFFVSQFFYFFFLILRNTLIPVPSKQWVRALLLLGLFEPSGPYNHRTTQ